MWATKFKCRRIHKRLKCYETILCFPNFPPYKKKKIRKLSRTLWTQSPLLRNINPISNHRCAEPRKIRISKQPPSFPESRNLTWNENIVQRNVTKIGSRGSCWSNSYELHGRHGTIFDSSSWRYQWSTTKINHKAVDEQRNRRASIRRRFQRDRHLSRNGPRNGQRTVFPAAKFARIPTDNHDGECPSV